MSARGASLVLGDHVVLRRVLAMHHLLHDTIADTVVDVADDLVGLHSTSPPTPYLSLHERIRGFAPADLDSALYESRELVRLKAMRGTVFVLSRRLTPLIFAATRAATVTSDRRWLGTNGEVYSRFAPKVLAELRGHSLTVAELRQALGPDPELAGVVAMLCDEGNIVRDRPVGSRASNTFRYRLWSDAFADVALGEWDECDATRELVRRYVSAYGPVTRADVIWWTGLPARRVDDAVSALSDEFLTVSVPGLGDGLLMTREAAETSGRNEAGPQAINLLPMLDPYTMGYKDRRRFLDPSLNETLIDRGGNMTSVVLVDGRVAGVWDLAQTPHPIVRVLLFDPDHRRRPAILDRAAETAAFWFREAVPVQEFTSMVPLRRRSGVMRRPLDDAEARSMTHATSRSPRKRQATTEAVVRRDPHRSASHRKGAPNTRE